MFLTDVLSEKELTALASDYSLTLCQLFCPRRHLRANIINVSEHFSLGRNRGVLQLLDIILTLAKLSTLVRTDERVILIVDF